jgi:hypothetical protein
MTVDAVGDGWTAADVEAGPRATRRRGVGPGRGLLRCISRRRPSRRSPATGVAFLDAQGASAGRPRGPLVEDTDLDRKAFSHLAVIKVNEEEGVSSREAGNGCAAGARRGGILLTLGSRGRA